MGEMGKTFLRMFWIVPFALMMAAIPAFAQSQDTSTHPGLEVRLTGGSFWNQLDEHGAMGPGFGGSVRYYLSQRFALETEILYSWGQHQMSGMSYKMLVCVPTILYHLTSPKKKTSIYVFAGIGFRRESFDWRTDYGYSDHETGVGAWLGLGLKHGGRIFYSLEIRFLGLAASIGYAFK
jgi:hypothetical protein